MFKYCLIGTFVGKKSEVIDKKQILYRMICDIKEGVRKCGLKADYVGKIYHE